MSYGGDSSYPNEIKQIADEIQRFESVHPHIYQAYNLINSIENQNLRLQLENQLGVVGGPNSGKTPLIHRYLTGSYRTHETSEGGRFKKDIVVNGDHLPDSLFSHWLDGALVVFSVTNRESYAVATRFLQLLVDFRKKCDFPVIVVATQDSISSATPRIVKEEEAKKKFKKIYEHCKYAEVCSTNGHRVEETFRTICNHIVHARYNYSDSLKRDYRPGSLSSGPATISSGSSSRQRTRQPPQTEFGTKINKRPPRAIYEPGLISHTRSVSAAPVFEPAREEHHTPSRYYGQSGDAFNSYRIRPDYISEHPHNLIVGDRFNDYHSPGPSSNRQMSANINPLPYTRSVTSYIDNSLKHNPHAISTSQLQNPITTPTGKRKNYRRISEMFMKPKDPPRLGLEGRIGEGR
ncbi:hypothetical protein M3Y97_00852100 [Aphelenchoides bicaudatus]|nr:hypothetical protein M3Y97_00852100 [Aphelenchoides bicaudatus]